MVDTRIARPLEMLMEEFLVFMIVGYKLSYPSGTDIAHPINRFDTPEGAEIVMNQVGVLFKSFGGSFLCSMFQWIYNGNDDYGFTNFAMLGLKAFKNKQSRKSEF